MQISSRMIDAVLAPLQFAGDATRFAQAATSSLGELLGARRAVLVERCRDADDTRTDPAQVQFVNWPDWCKPHYCRYERQRDPIAGWLDSGRVRADGGVARLSDLVPGRELVHAPYFETMLKPSGARHVITLALQSQGEVAGAFSLVRDEAEHDFTTGERDLARTLVPVLGLAYRVMSAERRVRALERASQVPTVAEALTPREHEVMTLAIRGHANKEIARLTGTSPWTVKNHLKAIFQKTGARNRAMLSAIMRRA
ncbi:helix-turn-helix transcriptional regulator [Variovorax sp. VNK109]|uniref:helix-turn-helix transcriptional regulator n=1 Tax=Variovorax sp. VNK109 TaxID=3400919 RepID=UPI003BFDA775